MDRFTSAAFECRAEQRFRVHMLNRELDDVVYFTERRQRLGAQMMRQRRVYLDTKFWVLLRKASSGEITDPVAADLLQLLRRSVSAGLLICPASYSVVAEVLRQNDPTSRRSTVQLLDDLSQGICTQPPHVLIENELYQFWAARQGASGVPAAQFAWTRAASVFGDMYVTTDGRSHTEMAMRCAVDDVLWDLEFKDALEAFSGVENTDKLQAQDLAQELNRDKCSLVPESATFADLYANELRGVLPSYRQLFVKVVRGVLSQMGQSAEAVAAVEEQAASRFAGTVFQSLTSGQAALLLPRLHIHSALHAAVIADRNRLYKGTDFEDFQHAAIALPYFNLFLTERSLRHLIRTPPIDAERIFGTRVVAGLPDAVRAIEELAEIPV